VGGSALYIRVKLANKVFRYSFSTSSWSQLPDSPTESCPSVIINNLLTLVGGYCYDQDSYTNQLFSLTGEGSGRRWSEEFPPMPTKRQGTTAACTGTAVIVAGGLGMAPIQTVEVMNTETLQWSTAADLPHPLSYAQATVCGDQIYILGKSNMYTCSLQALIQSHKSFLARFRKGSARVWEEVAAPPVTKTTCVSFHGRLLAIGGRYSDRKPTSAVHMYNPTTDSWEVISHMGTPRYWCIAAVLSNSRLMVVGGLSSEFAYDDPLDSIEFASIE
jgi:N-acetylneuraminic acid mutarotase